MDIEMHVPMPRDAIDQGASNTGVHAREWVRIEFPPSFPSKAPRFLLRADFNRAHPHINPGMPGELVNPCIYEGSLDELLHEPSWMDGLLNQLADWLSKAAAGDLMNCTGQGWEPIRRDGSLGQIVFDISAIRNRVEKIRGPGSYFLCYQYYTAESFDWYTGRILDEGREFRSAKEGIKFAAKKNLKIRKSSIGISLALVTWGDLSRAVDKYQPDNVGTLAELLEQAECYGCGDGLSHRLREFAKNAFTSLPEQNLDIAVLLFVKRPCPIIGDHSNLEVISYRVNFKSDKNRQVHFNRAYVFPLGHVHKVSRELLARASGCNPAQVASSSKHIVLLGCGSLGSKIVSHLARTGKGPFTLFDHDHFSPHNNARHAIANQMGGEFRLPKAWLLSEHLQQLSAQVKDDQPKDVVDWLQKNDKPLAMGAALVIDATAASTVHEALCEAKHGRVGAPLLRTALYGQGQIGFFALEGKSRNPRIDDLTAQLYQLGLHDPVLRRLLYRESGAFSRLTTGQACSSYTFPMSDARISLFAAGMAERISHHLDHGVPEQGEILIGSLDKNSMGVAWQSYPSQSVRSIEYRENTLFWEVRIPANVEESMAKWTEQSRPAETGGGLVGHINWGRRVIYVTELLPPPIDSASSSSRFILGTQGLRNEVIRIERLSLSTLTYLGTWHSHPNGGTTSAIDRNALKQLREERGRVPSLCLIYSHEGIRAVQLQS